MFSVGAWKVARLCEHEPTRVSEELVLTDRALVGRHWSRLLEGDLNRLAVRTDEDLEGYCYVNVTVSVAESATAGGVAPAVTPVSVTM